LIYVTDSEDDAKRHISDLALTDDDMDAFMACHPAD
jgi:hypothetical protein